MSALFISKEFGLCNRLRGLLNAWAIASEKKLHLDVLWIPNDDCPFEFTDLFELLPNMTTMKEYKYDIENIKNYSFITDYAGCLEEFCPLLGRKRSFHECKYSKFKTDSSSCISLFQKKRNYSSQDVKSRFLC